MTVLTTVPTMEVVATTVPTMAVATTATADPTDDGEEEILIIGKESAIYRIL
jgi:hypothetical protein